MFDTCGAVSCFGLGLETYLFNRLPMRLSDVW